MEGKTKPTFINFKNLRELPMPISAKDISKITGINTLPQGSTYINIEEARRMI